MIQLLPSQAILGSIILLALVPLTNAAFYRNVYGNALSSCSANGMARTGYTRTGSCVDENDDAGSHHICIDLSSAEQNFCQVTGQSDWCDSQMPCHDDAESDCPVQNWCVCQWAFATYIEKAGGCDEIQDIICEAINEQALLAYQKAQAGSTRYRDALECVVNRCGLEKSTLWSLSTSSGRVSTLSAWQFFFVLGAVLLAILGVMVLPRRQVSLSKQSLLNKEP